MQMQHRVSLTQHVSSAERGSTPYFTDAEWRNVMTENKLRRIPANISNRGMPIAFIPVINNRPRRANTMKNAATQLRLTTIALFAVLSFSAVAAGNEKAVASDKVQVQLTDGKSVVAEIDARTNADRLVLRRRRLGPAAIDRLEPGCHSCAS